MYWAKGLGSHAPLDAWLGITRHRYSPGVRELSCREASSDSFRHAAEDLARVGQIRLSPETIRTIVEAEGRGATTLQQRGEVRPEWSAEDCLTQSGTCVITGADGVKVPLVTEAEKVKRRANRRKKGPKARRRRKRIRRGSDHGYKEFKLVTFYDPSKTRQYVMGTSGNHEVLGRLMRKVGGWVGVDRADVSYSVSDGADWIRNQYQQRLPMLDANVLDYYHLREHVIAASYKVFGESTPEATTWREEMMGIALERGPLSLLDEIGQLRRSLRAKGKREALEKLRRYIGKRIAMLEYPTFTAKDYEIGSGPTEACCKTLTARLKGPGMRWDKPNAEGVMTLAAIRSSGLWKQYWQSQRHNAA